ncbi:MAG: hypothetical protein ACXWC9_08875 [Pseudobdellovibrionaceae bacterium]
MAIALSGGVVLGTSKLIADTGKSGARSERLFWLEARRLQFQNTIKSVEGWNEILVQNPALDCIESALGCSSYASPQTLKFPVDNIVLDGAMSTIGMKNDGSFCNSFDATVGNAACPLGLSFKWQIECDDSICRHGHPKITIQFQVRDAGSSSVESLSSYNLVVYKDPKLETLSEVCASMGGTFSGITCNLPQIATACSPSNGSFVLGFDNAGGVICGSPNPGSCAGADSAMGFDNSGGILCAPGCP